MPAFKDLSGTRFGMLLAVKVHATVSGKKMWLCRCDCGSTSIVSGSNLTTRQIKSCGCARYSRGHGLSGSSEWSAWKSMKARCTNPNSRSFANYGGRGIAVCQRWAESFEAFYEDMGPKPSPEFSLDRTDNSKGYSPDNCRWADRRTQSCNTRRLQSHNTSGYRGVVYRSDIGKWRAYLSVNNQIVHVGVFSNKTQAAIARDEYILANGLPNPLNLAKRPSASSRAKSTDLTGFAEGWVE